MTLHGTLAVPNLTRITVQGSTNRPREWLRLTIDPHSPGIFSWDNIVYCDNTACPQYSFLCATRSGPAPERCQWASPLLVVAGGSLFEAIPTDVTINPQTDGDCAWTVALLLPERARDPRSQENLSQHSPRLDSRLYPSPWPFPTTRTAHATGFPTTSHVPAAGSRGYWWYTCADSYTVFRERCRTSKSSS